MPTIWDFVDKFEKRFGRDAALLQSRALMIDYLSQVQKPLPAAAAKGLEVAKRIHSGEATNEERNQAREECWRQLTSREGWPGSEDPEDCILRAAAMSLDDAQVNRGQPEAFVIEWFFSFVEIFEGCKLKPFEPYTLKEEALLKKYFPLDEDSRQTFGHDSA